MMHRVIGVLPLATALIGSLWLVSAEALGDVVWDAVGEPGSVLFDLLAIPFFVGALLLSVAVFVRDRARGRFLPVLPLIVNVSALALCLFPPLDRALDSWDFAVHHAERADVVKRVESGELWNGSSLISSVSLPREYSRSVSNAGGQRGITVYRDGDALHVVFHHSTGLLRQRTAFLYRSDGGPPVLPNNVLPHTVGSEPLGDGWHRILFE